MSDEESEPIYCDLCQMFGEEDETRARVKPGDLVRRHQRGGLVHERCYASRAADIIRVRDHPLQAASVKREYAAKLTSLPTYYTEPYHA